MSSMMLGVDPRLDGISAKLDRAFELLDVVEKEYGEYLASQPYTALHDLKPTGHHIVTRLIVKGPVPARLGVLFGEVAHQARSSLDHLVCRLLDVRGKSISSRTSFPVMTTAEAWDNRVTNPTNAAGERVGGPLAVKSQDVV